MTILNPKVNLLVGNMEHFYDEVLTVKLPERCKLPIKIQKQSYFLGVTVNGDSFRHGQDEITPPNADD